MAQLPVQLQEQPHWTIRLLHWLDRRYRPELGWGVLLACLALACTPIFALNHNLWVRSQQAQNQLYAAALLATLLAWRLVSLLHASDRKRSRTGALFLSLLTFGVYLAFGAVILGQLFARWWPGMGAASDALRSGNWQAWLGQIQSQLTAFGARLLLWWQDGARNTLIRDDYMLAAVAAAVIWLTTGLLVYVVQVRRSGLTATLLLLMLIGALSFWGREGRWPMLLTIALGLLLHVLVHYQSLRQRWEAVQADYSPVLFWDRLVSAGGVLLGVLVLAAILPNLYIRPIANWYYRLIAPVNEPVQDLRQRLLPGDAASDRWHSGLPGSGLPNAFLLEGQPDLSQMVVMEVRTSDVPVGYGLGYGEAEAPTSHYLRAITLADYDGRSWRNLHVQTEPLLANQLRVQGDLPDGAMQGRRLLVQTIHRKIQSPVLFAAGEAVQLSVDSDVERLGLPLQDGIDDLTSLRSWAEDYTAISSIPDVGEGELAALTGWDERGEKSFALSIYLQLPTTISERTRQLASDLTQNLATPYAKAQAIEGYLRQLPYDLAIPPLPEDVAELTDYFVFELKRGYCDYYATAFVVLARLAGLPARFASGYTNGAWDAMEFRWVVTEAHAHSWPEVYFSGYGWIPFEPTAAQPLLARTEHGRQTQNATLNPAARPATNALLGNELNWQMLFWLLPAAGLAAGGVALWRWRRQRRADPWQRLLIWGERQGRPLNQGETIVEYGSALAQLVLRKAEQNTENEHWRAMSPVVLQLSAALSQYRYAPSEQRPAAMKMVESHWERAKEYF